MESKKRTKNVELDYDEITIIHYIAGFWMGSKDSETTSMKITVEALVKLLDKLNK